MKKIESSNNGIDKNPNSLNIKDPQAPNIFMLPFGMTSLLESLMKRQTKSLNYSSKTSAYQSATRQKFSSFFETLKEKYFQNATRNKHYANQLYLIKQELNDKDHYIGKMTTCFEKEILSSLREYNISLSHEYLMAINQFLYLINCNYYEKILSTSPYQNRGELIQKLITKICLYLFNTNKKIFDEEGAKVVLDSCFFLTSTIKKEILKEYINSKVKSQKETTYRIVRNDLPAELDAYLEASNAERKYFMTPFDVDNLYQYIQIEREIFYSYDEICLSQINLYSISVDLEFVRKLMQTTIKINRTKLLELYENYSNFAIVYPFIQNVVMYAIVNNESNMDQMAILRAYEKWPDFPFEIKLNTINEMFSSKQIDCQYQPFADSFKKTKNHKKVFHLSQTSHNNN